MILPINNMIHWNVLDEDVQDTETIDIIMLAYQCLRLVLKVSECYFVSWAKSICVIDSFPECHRLYIMFLKLLNNEQCWFMEG